MRSAFNISSETEPRSPASLNSTTSPGITRIRMNVTTATPSKVGNISANRFSRYFHICGNLGRRPGWTGVPPTLLLAEPDRVELVVQVMAGSDGPPLDLGAVRDDPMPLQRVDHMGFLVEQPLLECPEVLPPLLGLHGPRLLLEEVVDHRVLVLAVVGIRGAEEARQIEIGLDYESALEVHRHLEIAALEHRVIGRGLDELLLHGDADLPPLIDEPDAHGFVGVRDPAVLEGERQSLCAGFLEELAGLGSVGIDVAPVAGQLLELSGRGRPRGARHLDAADVAHQGDLGQVLRSLV